MALFRRRRRTPDTPSAARRTTIAHLQDFVDSRVGVEAYVEPATSVTPTTLILIATDGEWTRRKVPDAKAAFDVARGLGVPVYDVQRTGYPQRMRDWTARQRSSLRRPGSGR